MKLLKEDFGQSQDLNAFVAQAQTVYQKIYKVTIYHEESNPQYQEQYFAFEDAARDYYEKALVDIEDKYGWEDADINLYEVDVKLDAVPLIKTEEQEEDILPDDELEILPDDTIAEE